MTKMSGIELSNIIREKNKDVEIVFVTVFFNMHYMDIELVHYNI